MAAQNIAENDEEIIDLTELIEKGEVPADDAALAHGQAEETLSDQIQSLNDLPQEADQEIDALLAQMEVKDDRVPAGDAAQARRVDANEELDMSGMGEVDKLLDTLDIPPQPHEDGAARAPASYPADAGSIDSAVDDLLDSLSPTPRTTPESEQKPDVYDLLSGASEPHAAGNALPDDLDALLQDQAPHATSAPSSSAPRDSEPDLAADLDDLLAAAEKPVPPSDLAPAAAQKAADLTADLDSLLAAMSAEPDAEPHGAAPAPPRQAPPQDQTRDAQAPDTQTHKAASAQAAPQAPHAAAPADMPGMEGENAPHAPRETTRKSGAEPAPDLDDLLAAAEKPVPPSDIAPAAAQKAEDLTADLDSLLAAMSAEPDADPHDAAPAPARQAPAEDQTQQVEAPGTLAPEDAAVQAAPQAPPAAAPADMPEMEGENAPHASHETTRKSGAEPAPDLDDLLTPAEKPVPPSDIAVAAAQKASDLTADLDDLLTAMGAEQDAEPHDAAPAPARQAPPPAQTQQVEAPGTLAPEDAAVQAAPQAPPAAAPADMPEMDGENAPHAPHETIRKSGAEPAPDLDDLLTPAENPVPPSDIAVAAAQKASDLTADLDDLLTAMGAEQELPSAPEDAPLPLQEEEERAAAADSQSGDETDSTQACAPHEPEQSAAELTESAAEEEQTLKPEASVAPDPDRLLTEPAQQTTDEPDAGEQDLDFAAASACSFMDGGSEPATALDDLLIAAVPEHTSSLPAEQDAGPLSAQQTPAGKGPQCGLEAHRAEAEEIVSLGVRLRHCEAELADARLRIAALERASGAAAASLEDLLRDGSPLHDRFAGLIASSVREALKSAPTGISEQVLDERLQAVSLASKSISARMDALETRLDHLEPRFNTEVEKAAAGAAARILREEIAKLVQN